MRLMSAYEPRISVEATASDTACAKFIVIFEAVPLLLTVMSKFIIIPPLTAILFMMPVKEFPAIEDALDVVVLPAADHRITP